MNLVISSTTSSERPKRSRRTTNPVPSVSVVQDSSEDVSTTSSERPRRSRRTTNPVPSVSTVDDSDEDMIPGTPPQRTTRSKRTTSKR